ncbi:MAG: DUF1329 domain-containing protein [Gammaproteobacteria bacterium]|nr:DUF1329 domain-containing protein [Gammaproteobacteria bacterium]
MHLRNIIALLMVLAAPLAGAKVSEEEAARLGQDLTPGGAEKAANGDGSIPAWGGTIRGLPPGLDWGGPGTVYPDPYAGEKPLFSITADKMAEYAQRLSVGQQALFTTYPKTFRMDIYPTHRDFRDNATREERTAYNARHAELYNGDDGINGYNGGLPFPIPKLGAEPIWNSRLNSPSADQEGYTDDVAVYPNDTRALRRGTTYMKVLFSDPKLPMGADFKSISKYSAYIWFAVDEPVRDKGTITLILEPLDYSQTPRSVWRYLPGSRRIRQAPNVGYDTPDGPGGILTIDDTLGFNGAMDRFEWKIAGRQEMYVPFHSYRFDDPALTEEQLLTAGHANPDYMRYELRRVWIVEATLREGFRHIYGKRRFYVEEDGWNIAIAENYDGRGELWKTVLINSIYAYDLEGYEKRTQMFHDLRAGIYNATRLTNWTKPWNFSAEDRGADFYTPANLRKSGRR